MSENIPKIRESNGFNLFTSIWIVPFIALIIASWLAFQYFSQLGPKIEIVFKNNKGLQAKKRSSGFFGRRSGSRGFGG